MHGNGRRSRAKTANLAFPPILSTNDGQDPFSSANNIFFQNGQSTSTLSSSMPKEWMGARPSNSTHFLRPPIPLQNPKLKLQKRTEHSAPRSIRYIDQKVRTPAIGPFKPDNNVFKTTITIPILPHRLKKNPTVTKSSPTRKSYPAPTPHSHMRGIQKKPPVRIDIVTPDSSVNDSTGATAVAVGNSNSLPFTPLIGAKLSDSATKDRSPALVERFKISRSELEREENPECIRLDKLGLKQFPFIGGEENRLKVLSIQSNLISRLDNLPPLTHLLVLDLYDNRIERITGLHGFNSLKVLLLGKNRIRRIEGLDGLKRLEILDLHGNQLRYVDNLASLSSLRVLNLAGNLLRTIRNLGPYGLSSLSELNLKRNQIKNLEGLQKAPHIKKLFLANNDLQSMSSLQPLKKLTFLKELLLQSNPLCSVLDYTNQIITLFPDLEILDKIEVSEQMKSDAKAWQKQRLVEEEARRKELEKLHATFASSRDEVIFEAKRRWESLKNFVTKNSVDPEILGNYRTNAKVKSSEIPISRTPDPMADETLLNSSDNIELPSDDFESEVEPNDTQVFDPPRNCQNSTLLTNSEIVNALPVPSPEKVVISDCNIPRNARSDFEVKKLVDNFTQLDTIKECQSPEPSYEFQTPKPNPRVTKVAVVRPQLRATKTLDEQYRVQVDPRSNPPETSQDLQQIAKTPGKAMETNVKNNATSKNSEEIDQFSIMAALSTDDIKVDALKEVVGSRSQTPVLRRSKSEFNILKVYPKAEEVKPTRPSLAKWRSSSIDISQFPDGESDTSDVESVATSTITSEAGSRKGPRRQASRNKWKVARQPSIPNLPGKRPSTSIKERSMTSLSGNRAVRRVDSAIDLDKLAPPILKRQGTDYLVEIDGKILSIYGQGALKHTLPGFTAAICAQVTTVNFHFISFDAIIPYFGKIKQCYQAIESFHFRSNNLCILSQLNSLSDLQGIASLQISSEGNPIVEHLFWKEYAIYRLAHWGLQILNGKEVVSEYRGSGRIIPDTDHKMFDSLGYLALSCLPQTALKPLAKRLHTLQCFSAAVSPPSSSDESSKPKPESGHGTSAGGNIGNIWDDDPVLLDVIGKEALVYAQRDSNVSKDSQEIALKIINGGQLILEKLDMLDKVWPAMMCEAVEDILTDYMFMDNYMKKGLKRLNDEFLANDKFK